MSSAQRRYPGLLTCCSYVAETQIRPRAVAMATCVLGELSQNKLGTVQLPNSNVKRRIQDLSADTEQQLVWRLCFASFVAT